MGPVVCMVTGSRDDLGEGAVLDHVARAVRSGVHLIQVRQPGLDGGPLLRLVERCLAIARGSRARVIVNDRLDVALAAGAHGVHLRTGSMPAARVRRIVPDGFLIGRSVHGAEEARRETGAGALDYLLAGTVFPTSSKSGVAAIGLEGLRAIVSATSVPVLAIGGMTLGSVDAVRTTGAVGFAAIGLFARGGDSL
jgi:thiamine-phosphate diphosphorylase